MFGRSLKSEIINSIHFQRQCGRNASPKTNIDDKINQAKRHFVQSSFSKKKNELDKALVRFIVKDIQPLAVVDDDGFAEFVHALDPRCCLPSRRHLRDVLLEQAYQKTVQHIGEILKPIKFIALTYDGWTSRTTQGYLVVTGHFIFEEKLSTATLGVIPIPSRSTSKNLKELIFSVLKRFPSVSVVCAVTDSGSNMISACDLMKIKYKTRSAL
ncbi:uncharacterized protein LOC129732408 [Wyeomyia smithii]|uniref:uncharacterized protein LOC129732408 n=1 Tax=Wyeomyia smithii TaxID=174621 RepID=UPI002467C0D4|nr:uncharacterized protein LOC129732408 [Wyeomyia smithii]